MRIFKKLRAYMDVGRVQGISTTASMALIGALSSTGSLDLNNALAIIIISCFSHTAGGAYNELNDLELDKQIPELSKKPLVCGNLTVKETKIFVIVCIILAFASLLIFFPKRSAILTFILSGVWVMWYCSGRGKHVFFSYDFSFGLGYAFYALFGAFAIGSFTIYTWIFAAIVLVSGGLFAQWENGLKDADFDRKVGIKSFAVKSGVYSTQKLNFSHPYFIYGVCIKIIFLLLCFIAYLQWLSLYYLIFLLLYGIPSQVYILYRFLAKQTRLEQRKTILLDVPIAAVLGFSVIVGKVGILPIILVLLFLIAGYLKGSLYQYGAEFKFAGYSKSGVSRYEFRE